MESAWERSAMASSTFPALILTTSSSWDRASDFIIISQTLNQVTFVRVFSPRIIFLAYDDYIPGWQGGGCKRFGDSELAAA